MDTQIIAMGGGGFSMEPDNLLLDQYILTQSKIENPKVCFIPTASGDADGYIQRFLQSFQSLKCQPSYLSLYDPPVSIESFIMEQDIIYVGGGNTKNMLALWKEWGLDAILYRAWKKGIVLAGLSAGSMCWFEQGLTDSLPGVVSPITCLGFINGSHCPHYDGEEDRRPGYHAHVKNGLLKPGIAADDGVALHFINGQLQHVVSSRKEASAYRLNMIDEEVREERINPQFLG